MNVKQQQMDKKKRKEVIQRSFKQQGFGLTDQERDFLKAHLQDWRQILARGDKMAVSVADDDLAGKKQTASAIGKKIGLLWVFISKEDAKL